MENTNSTFQNYDIYAASDIGKKRKNNEDSAYCARSQYGVILCVADGMGGHRKGEVASKMVVDSLSIPFQELKHEMTLFRAKYFVSHFSKKVNKEIYRMSVSYDEYREMGTTEAVAVICNDGTYIFSVGDSRVYSYSKDKGLNQVTVDQSYVEMLFESGRINKSEMLTHPQRNLLTNAVGLNGKLVNYEQYELKNDSYDSLLLCTDGLFNMVSDEEITGVLSGDGSAEDKTKKLVQLALNHGGIDNVAVVVLEK